MSKFTKINRAIPFYKNPKYLTISIGILIIFIMVTSVLTYSLFSSSSNVDEELNYKGLYFYKTNGIWHLNTNGVLFNFPYSPKELEPEFASIPLSYGPAINYIAFDPKQINENEPDVVTLEQVLNIIQPEVKKACIKSSSKCGNLKKVNCKNENKVFYINRSTSDTITVSDNCYVLNMPGVNSKVLTYLTYKIIGIM